MELAFKVFMSASMAAGAVGLITLAALALGLALTQLWRMCKVYNVLVLCAAVWVHGRDYRDDLFWRAVRERVEKSRFEAENIADFAMKHAPKDTARQAAGEGG